MTHVLAYLLYLLFREANAQTPELKYYDPNADALKEVHEAVSKDNQSNKHVLLQIGGNWFHEVKNYVD